MPVAPQDSAPAMGLYVTTRPSGSGAIGFDYRQLHNKIAGQKRKYGQGNQVRFGPVAWPAGRRVAGSW